MLLNRRRSTRGLRTVRLGLAISASLVRLMGGELRVTASRGLIPLFFTLHMPVYAGQISEQEEQKGVSGYSLKDFKYF